MITFVAVVLAAIIIDVVSKVLVNHFMEIGEVVPLIPRVLSLQFSENSGAAGGFLSNWAGSNIFFMILNSILIALIVAVYVYFYRRARIKQERVPAFFNVAFAIFVGGGIGNIVCRIAFGAVRDFIRIDLFTWPIFNFADVWIVVGAIMLVIYFLFMNKDWIRTRTPDALAQPTEAADE